MTDRPVTDTPSLERLLETYFANHLPRPLRRAWIMSALRQVMGVDDILALAVEIKNLSDFAAVDAIMARGGIAVSYQNTENIPPQGRLLVLANHPVGAADVFLMLQCLHHIRNDVRVVINKLGPLLVPHITGLCLAVDRYSKFNPEARSRISAALCQEQAVILFPAGGISKLTMRGVRDHPWKHGAVHFVRTCETDVLPVYIAGRSSPLFLALPRKLRHFLVAREMLHPVRQPITVRVGSLIPYSQLATGDVAVVTQQLQQTVYALATKPLSHAH